MTFSRACLNGKSEPINPDTHSLLWRLTPSLSAKPYTFTSVNHFHPPQQQTLKRLFTLYSTFPPPHQQILTPLPHNTSPHTNNYWHLPPKHLHTLTPTHTDTSLQNTSLPLHTSQHLLPPTKNSSSALTSSSQCFYLMSVPFKQGHILPLRHHKLSFFRNRSRTGSSQWTMVTHTFSCWATGRNSCQNSIQSYYYND